MTNQALDSQANNTVCIEPGSEVVLHFDLKLSDGSAADSTRVNNKPAKLIMGDGNVTANFEACLLGLAAGDPLPLPRQMRLDCLIQTTFITWTAVNSVLTRRLKRV